jgi:hypothetical protein
LRWEQGRRHFNSLDNVNKFDSKDFFNKERRKQSVNER